MQEWNEKYQEGYTRLEVWKNNNLVFDCRLDYTTVETDERNFFKIKAYLNNMKKVIDSKENIEVNLLDNKDIDGGSLSPITLRPCTLRSKEILTVSEWSTGDEDFQIPVKNGTSPDYTLPFKELISQGIDNSTTQDPSAQQIPSEFYFSNSVIVQFKTPFKGRLIVSNIDVDISSFSRVQCMYLMGMVVYILKYPEDNFSGTPYYTNDSFTLYGDVDGVTNRCVYLRIARQERDIELPANSAIAIVIKGSAIAESNDYVNVKKDGRIRIEGVNKYEDLDTRGVTFFDVGKQIITSITNGLAFFKADIFDKGGQYERIWAFSGFLVRAFPPYDPSDPENPNNKPFVTTWKDYVATIREQFNCDWQLVGNEVRIFRHENFYTDTQAHKFNTIIPVSKQLFNSVPNETLLNAKLEFGYKTYQDDEKNTIDSVHTESSWYLPETKLSETVSKEIPYISDAFKIEYSRREGLLTNGTQSTSNDDNVYLVDMREPMTLTPPRPMPQIPITITYNATQEYVSVTKGTLFSPETMYNLRLSIKRLLVDNFSKFIANMSQVMHTLKNTYYKNNSLMETTATGIYPDMTSPLTFTEGADFTPEFIQNFGDPLITPKQFEGSICTRVLFEQMLEWINKIQETNGYVTLEFDNGKTIDLYVKEMEYNILSKIFTLKGEEKYHAS